VKHVRPLISVIAVVVAAGCADSTSLTGRSDNTGSGSLLVHRREMLPGQLTRRTAIDAATGVTTATVPWFPIERVITNSPTYASSVTFSRDGQWMAWIEISPDTTVPPCFGEFCFPSNPNRDLYVARVGSSTRTRLTPDYQRDGAPSFSRDGRRLVLHREYHGGDQQLITISRDGGDPRPVLPRTSARAGAPDWSPSSDHIAYWSADGRSVQLVRQDGSERRQVADGISANIGRARWAPDGGAFAAIVVDAATLARRDLVVFDPDGAVLRTVPVPDAASFDFTWSPDASQVAYCASAPPVAGIERTVVRVVTIATEVVRTITPERFSDCSPLWRP
jgi:Tol biopolymer transport system component